MDENAKKIYMADHIVAIAVRESPEAKEAYEAIRDYTANLESELAATKARLAGYEEGYDPKVSPALKQSVLMMSRDGDYFEVEYHLRSKTYWDGDNWWKKDCPDLKRWFPLPGKGGEA